MKIVHVLRKPLASGSVAQNLLDHGAGALNIDAGRLSTSDNLDDGAYSPGGRGALPGDERTGPAAGMFREGGGRLPGQYKPPSGRWPANLILQHLPGCRKVGTKEVGHGEKIVGGPPRTPTAHLGQVSGQARTRAVMSYGTETVENWECQSGCPVADMDEQSGDCPTGASRFFKQVQGD